MNAPSAEESGDEQLVEPKKKSGVSGKKVQIQEHETNEADDFEEEPVKPKKKAAAKKAAATPKVVSQDEEEPVVAKKALMTIGVGKKSAKK